jgi:hypothetical protein
MVLVDNFNYDPMEGRIPSSSRHPHMHASLTPLCDGEHLNGQLVISEPRQLIGDLVERGQLRIGQLTYCSNLETPSASW